MIIASVIHNFLKKVLDQDLDISERVNKMVALEQEY